MDLPKSGIWLNAAPSTLQDHAGRPLVLAFVNGASVWCMQRLAEVAQWLDCAPEAIDALLPRLQTLEPTGVFARSLAEHLRLCLQARGRYDPMIAALLGRWFWWPLKVRSRPARTNRTVSTTTELEMA